jgi:hypothetical protein
MIEINKQIVDLIVMFIVIMGYDVDGDGVENGVNVVVAFICCLRVNSIIKEQLFIW